MFATLIFCFLKWELLLIWECWLNWSWTWLFCPLRVEPPLPAWLAEDCPSTKVCFEDDEDYGCWVWGLPTRLFIALLRIAGERGLLCWCSIIGGERILFIWPCLEILTFFWLLNRRGIHGFNFITSISSITRSIWGSPSIFYISSFDIIRVSMFSWNINPPLQLSRFSIGAFYP